MAVEPQDFRDAAINALLTAFGAISMIPEDQVGGDVGNLGSASDHISAALSRLGADSVDMKIGFNPVDVSEQMQTIQDESSDG
jgi:hypothetical protein